MVLSTWYYCKFFYMQCALIKLNQNSFLETINCLSILFNKHYVKVKCKMFMFIKYKPQEAVSEVSQCVKSEKQKLHYKCML